jgi:hypothetical protein
MVMLMSPEGLVPEDHPLRAFKKMADAALGALSPVFDAMYTEGGRAPSKRQNHWVDAGRFCTRVQNCG